VSGGPIYITDVPGQHDIELIGQMTGQTPRGDTVILRPSTVGKSSSAYNAYDDTVLLKVSTYVGMAHTGVSILGIFNCTPKPLTELIGLDAFPGAEEGTYVIRSHTDGQVSKSTSVATNESFVHLELPVRGWEILSAYPLQSFTLQRGNGNGHAAKGPEDISVACLGVLEKMTGAAAIINTDFYIDQESGRLRVQTSLKVLGTYGMFFPSRLPYPVYLILLFLFLFLGHGHGKLITPTSGVYFRPHRPLHLKRLLCRTLRSSCSRSLCQSERAVRECA
jgi:hypothetical protein